MSKTISELNEDVEWLHKSVAEHQKLIDEEKDLHRRTMGELDSCHAENLALREQNATLGAQLAELREEAERAVNGPGGWADMLAVERRLKDQALSERHELAKRLEAEQKAHAVTADNCAKEIAALKAALQRQVEK